MIDVQAIRDAEVKKLSIALRAYQDTAADERSAADLWRNSSQRGAKAYYRAALMRADEADQKARDIELLIRNIKNWSEQEAEKAKGRAV